MNYEQGLGVMFLREIHSETAVRAESTRPAADRVTPIPAGRLWCESGEESPGVQGSSPD